MKAADRRQYIHEQLKAAAAPISAGTLANDLSVSRQIIVGDVALLRASGVAIVATPRGYILSPDIQNHSNMSKAPTASGNILQIEVACKHNSEEMERELQIIVDNGGIVLDVIVEHPVYGQITGPLHLQNRYDIGQFMERINEAEAQPLSALTDGIHLHTIRAANKETLVRIQAELDKAGFLLSPDAGDES